MQGVARHWHNPVCTRVTPLDSSDALYIVFLVCTVKPMDNVVRFRHPCVGPVHFTHAPIVSLTCALYPRTYCQFNLCALRTYLLLVQPVRLWRPHLLLDKPVRFTHATIANSTCAFSQHLCVSPVRFTHATIANSTCAFLQHLCVRRTPL